MATEGRQTGLTDATGTASWGYDAASMVTMVETVGTTPYSYDSDSRLTSLEIPYSETTSLSYDAASRLTQKTFASGMYDTFGYDSWNRITSLSHKNSEIAPRLDEQLEQNWLRPFWT